MGVKVIETARFVRGGERDDKNAHEGNFDFFRIFNFSL
jgi:hypothetical protein